jgi:hypothetical protein
MKGMSDEVGSITARFRLSRSDYFELCRRLYRFGWWAKVRVVAYVAALEALVVLFVSEDPGYLFGELLTGRQSLQSYAWLALPFVLGLCMPWIAAFGATVGYRDIAAADQDTEVTLAPDHIEAVISSLRSRIEWSAVRRIVRTPAHIFVFVSKREGLALPLRGFASHDEFEHAWALIKARAPAGTPTV